MSQTKEFIVRKETKPASSKLTLHPGSSAADAKAVGGKNDFGARESDVIERQYTSQNAKQSVRRSTLNGSTVQLPDESTLSAQGADAASPVQAQTDASAGEVSSDEASGRNDAGD